MISASPKLFLVLVSSTSIDLRGCLKVLRYTCACTLFRRDLFRAKVGSLTKGGQRKEKDSAQHDEAEDDVGYMKINCVSVNSANCTRGQPVIYILWNRHVEAVNITGLDLPFPRHHRGATHVIAPFDG